jgi:dolichol-phosphate mannosyltransferase
MYGDPSDDVGGVGRSERQPQPDLQGGEQPDDGAGREGARNHWQIPPFAARSFAPKRSDLCILTAAWDEGPASLAQYERMRPFSAEFDFIIVNRGTYLPSQGDERLAALRVNTLLQVDTPGQSPAYRAGLAFALRRGYEHVIILDSNGKDDVTSMPQYVQALCDGTDLVQGSRFMAGGHHEHTPIVRQIAIRVVAAFLLWLGTGYWYSDQTNGFKGLSRRFLLDPRVQPFRDILAGHSLLVYLNYAAARHGFRVVQVPASRVYPADGTVPTKLSTGQALLHILDYLRAITGRFDPP